MATLPRMERSRRMSHEDRAKAGSELLRRYETGRSIRELADESGYSIGRVRRLLIEAGVEFRSRGGRSNRTR